VWLTKSEALKFTLDLSSIVLLGIHDEPNPSSVWWPEDNIHGIPYWAIDITHSYIPSVLQGFIL